MSRMYHVNDVETGKYYKLEKSLFEIEKYKPLSIGSKVIYAILRDRQTLSVENEWYDKLGFIYFYFDCNELSKLVNVSTSTINGYKKELISAELLLQARQGQGRPNRLYILKPETIADTLISDFHYSRNAESTKLELLKSLCNKTYRIKTEKERLNDNTVLSNSASVFLKAFKDYFGYEHRRIKGNPYLECDYMEDEELYDSFIEYFDKYANGNKKHDAEKCSVENVFASYDRHALFGEW